MNTYKLVGKVPVKCDMWNIMPDADRVISRDVFGQVTVSTVFLQIDHSFLNEGPVLFETMIFGGEWDEYQERYQTYDEAVEGHKRACDMVNKVSIDRDNKLNDLGL